MKRMITTALAVMAIAGSAQAGTFNTYSSVGEPARQGEPARSVGEPARGAEPARGVGEPARGVGEPFRGGPTAREPRQTAEMRSLDEVPRAESRELGFADLD